MSFFDDTKNAGLLLLIIALMDIILTVVAAFVAEAYKDAELWKKIVFIVGGVVGAAIYALLGFDIKNGKCRFDFMGLFSDVNSKFGVLVAITAAVGVGDIISGLFTIIGFGGSGVFDIIIGVLFVVMAYLMVNGGNLAGNVIWIILLIIYILGVIFGIIAALALIGIPMLLLMIMLLVFLLSPEVKQRMGM